MRFAVIGILVLMWLATLAVAVTWVAGIDLGIEPEPITVLLGTASTGLTAIVAYFGVKLEATRRELEEERFSTPMALAWGYVSNFLEPAVTHLLKETPPGGASPRIHIFIPEQLEELLPASRERILARMRAANCRDEVVQLEFREGRARDIITITRSDDDEPVYFDFPTTLLTLTALVDYKVESSKDSFSTHHRATLGHDYIEKFHAYLKERIETLGLSEHTAMTNKDLGFLGTEHPERAEENQSPS